MSSKKSYSTILKSSSLVGGAEIIKILIGMVSVKFIAVFLGPVGVGIVGLYNATLNVIARIVGLGIAGSGVREVASAAGENDQKRIGEVAFTLKRMCWVTGSVGTIGVIFFSEQLSRITFGSDENSWAFLLLGWVLLMNSLQTAQLAYLQGIRRIKDLAKIKIVGALGGTIIGIFFYSWLRIDGIVPALLSIAAFNLAVALWFSLKSPAPKVTYSWKKSLIASKDLIKLGIALMWTGLTTAVVAYFTRWFLNIELGLAAVGIFQSSFRLSGMFVNFVLQAMGTDFYPRLTSVKDDNEKMTDLVNEQTEVGLLLSIPGILAVISIAPWIIYIFYTAEFIMAADLLRWFVLGCLGRVISWPMGYILVAKGKGGLMIISESLVAVLHVILIFIGVRTFGVIGVSVAFLLLYVFYTIYILLISKVLINFRWSQSVVKLLFKLIPVTIFIFLLCNGLPDVYGALLGTLFSIITGFFCARELVKLLGEEHKISKILRSVLFVKIRN